jgi:hypothetical protein
MLSGQDDKDRITCPDCHADIVTIMAFLSSVSDAWQMRCGACGHLWTLPKDAASTRPRIRSSAGEPS